MIDTFHGIEYGWYLAAAISVPLVIWFCVTRRKELKGRDEMIKKPTHIAAE